MISFRSGVAAVAILGAMLSAPSAHATPVAVAFNDVGFGNLSGPGQIDGATAILNATLTETSPGLTNVNSVVESLNGHPFTLTQHGSQIGTGNTYLAGFTFNVVQGTDIAVTNVSPGVSGYIVVKDKSTLGAGAFPASVSGVGSTVASYANLAAGKYTLFLEGVVDLALNGSTSVSATISAVPLPGSLVMFGSALIGLTAFGARRRVGITA